MKLKVPNKEVWKPVNGTQVYFVSNLGRVKSVKNGKERIVKLYSGGNYLSCNMYFDGKQKTILTHLAVAEAFLGDKPDGYVVNHIDGDKFNNRVENLEYVTYSENSVHAFDSGLSLSGEKHSNSHLTDRDVILIKILWESGYTDKELSERFEVDRRTINRIRNGQSRSRELPTLSIKKVNSLGDKTMKTALTSSHDCPKGKIPVVVFHQHGTSKDYIALSLEDFFKLVPEENVIRKKVKSSD